MRKWIIIISLVWISFLSGCRRNEIENRAFPLAMGIGVRTEKDYEMYVAYPDLLDKDAKENALSKDIFRSAAMTDLLSGVRIFSQESSKNVDMNHLKVLILDRDMLDGGEHADRLISFLRGKRNAAWNTYIMATDKELPELFKKEEALNTCLGIYLENLMEGWTNLRSGGLITAGDLMGQYYNQRGTLLIPVVTVEKEGPTVHSFAEVETLKWKSQKDLEEILGKYHTLKPEQVE